MQEGEVDVALEVGTEPGLEGGGAGQFSLGVERGECVECDAGGVWLVWL